MGTEFHLTSILLLTIILPGVMLLGFPCADVPRICLNNFHS